MNKDKNSNQIITFALDNLKDIEEFRLPLSSGIETVNSKKYFQRTEVFPSYWIDLKKIGHQDSILSIISKNKKSQITRSIKEYEKKAPIKLEIAKNLDQALNYFLQLENLHQKEWKKRGHSGAFANAFFKKFHLNLIRNCFPLGKVNLIRVHTASEDIGYLYYFIHNNEALFYQSGLNYKESNKFKPGLVCHYMASSTYKKLAFEKYNFLAGNDQYKKSLSTDFDNLSSIVIARKNIKSNLEYFLRRVGEK